MKLRWELDDGVTIVLEKSLFDVRLKVDGRETGENPFKRKETPLTLPDGRRALFERRKGFGFSPLIQLSVDGIPIAEVSDVPEACGACGAKVKASDRFCGSCGHALPPPEHYWHRRDVKRGQSGIWVLAGLFALSGIIMFFLTRANSADMLKEVSAMKPDAVLHPGGGQ